MSTNMLPKQPSESFYVGIEFSTIPLASGETIVMSGTVNGQATNSVVKAYQYNKESGLGDEKTDTVIVSDTLAIKDDTILKVKVKAGLVTDKFYKISLGAVTSYGNFYERDLFLGMED